MSEVQRVYGGELLRFDVDVDLWERQSGESDLDFSVFREYIQLPLPRKLVRLVREGRVEWSIGHLRRVAVQGRWEERALAWDVEDQRAFGGEIASERLRVARERIGLLDEMLGLSCELIRETPREQWRPRDKIELFRLTIEAQNALLGLRQLADAQGAVGAAVGVEVSLPLGASSGVIEGEISALMAEIAARETGQVDAGPEEFSQHSR